MSAGMQLAFLLSINLSPPTAASTAGDSMPAKDDGVFSAYLPLVTPGAFLLNRD